MPPALRRSATFARRLLVLPPGARRPYRAGEWKSTFVSIDSGRIELERAGQPARLFQQGDVLWLTGLGLSAIHNPGPTPAILTLVSRLLT